MTDPVPDPVAPVYCDDNTYDISPSHSRYRSVVEDYILPHFDIHTRMSLLMCYDPPGEIDFAMSPDVPGQLFTVTRCDNTDFLRWFMVDTGMIPEEEFSSSVMRSFRWTKKDVCAFMCSDDDYLVATLSKDGFNTIVQLTPWNGTEIDPEVHKLIGYLGQREGDIHDPLDMLLPVGEPRRPGESNVDFLMRARNSLAFWEKRRAVWQRYVRLHDIDVNRVEMIPELYDPL